MKNERPEKTLEWLQSKPSLEDLGTEFPELREAVRQEIAQLIADGNLTGLPAYLKRMSQTEKSLERKHVVSRGDKKIAAALVLQAVRTRIAHLSIKQHLVSEATGIEKGKVRFNLLNGFFAQRLLFADGLVRKPVSLFWFRLFWPLLRQKRLLMPLVQPKGIYCFYSRQLVDALAMLIASRTCLEIAAGDGTLTRFLTDSGVKISATDDHSWKHEVNYPEFVVKRDANEALREYSPEVVLCSWPPAGNTFEHQVFRTRSVQLYIVIGSRHRFAAGNWDDYLQQSSFGFEEDKKLSGLVLPPELDAAVYVFRRNRVG
ncbi:MAG: SAM-dependent methyltransferase [Geobacteraceae bacterium]|nr:SAM-dependent methyltransferase [Geobacteraceae bacterium]NTW79978.1 SAM-dependent methyltransferase [Geobacteraceae bacterium]